MERRNSEAQEHAFADEVTAYCGIHDLQGLLMDSNDHFSVALEAFVADNDEKLNGRMRDVAFTKEELLSKIGFANALGIEFHVFAHRKDSDFIQQYRLTKDAILAHQTVPHRKLTETEFLLWWKEHKGTIQTKGYRDEFKEATKDSYFDILLENPEDKQRDAPKMRWGGNIDAFLSSDDGQYRPIAIIENRFTKEYPIESYNPGLFFKSDIMAWNPLFLIAKTLHIPLILCVYSKRPGERHKIAMAEIDVSRSTDHLEYVNVPKPGENILESKEAAKEWFDNVLCRWQNPMPA